MFFKCSHKVKLAGKPKEVPEVCKMQVEKIGYAAQIPAKTSFTLIKIIKTYASKFWLSVSGGKNTLYFNKLQFLFKTKVNTGKHTHERIFAINTF